MDQKILRYTEQLKREDVEGYQGMFLTDATVDEIAIIAIQWFPCYAPTHIGVGMGNQNEDNFETTLRIHENKPKFEEFFKLFNRGFVTRVDCFGAGKPLKYVEELIRALLAKGHQVALILPFRKYAT